MLIGIGDFWTWLSLNLICDSVNLAKLIMDFDSNIV